MKAEEIIARQWNIPEASASLFGQFPSTFCFRIGDQEDTDKVSEFINGTLDSYG